MLSIRRCTLNLRAPVLDTAKADPSSRIPQQREIDEPVVDGAT